MAKDKAKKTTMKIPLAAGERLTPQQVDMIMENETTFAEYMATLSTEQIDAYLLLLAGDKTMEKKARASFIALLKEVRNERQQADVQAALVISPVVSSIETLAKLDAQIEALEKIADEINSSR